MSVRAGLRRAARVRILRISAALVFAALSVQAEPAVPAWERALAGPPASSTGMIYAARQLADGSIMTVQADGAGFRCRRVNAASGVLLSQASVFPPWPRHWYLSFDLTSIRYASVAIDPFGRVAISTIANERRAFSALGYSDVWTMRYDGLTGRALWTAPAIYHGSFPVNEPMKTLIDPAGGVVLLIHTGDSSPFPVFFGEAALVRYDGDSGQPSWPSAHVFPTLGTTPEAIAVDALGAVYFAWELANDVQVAKVAVSGQLLWSSTIDFGPFDEPNALGLDGAGGLIVTANDGSRPGVAKLDAATGGIVWGPVPITTPFTAFATGLGIDANGNPVVAVTSFEDYAELKLRVFKFNGSTGSLRWESPPLGTGADQTLPRSPATVAIGGNGDVFVYMLTQYNGSGPKTWPIAGLTGFPLLPTDFFPDGYGQFGRPPIAFVTSAGSLIRSGGAGLVATDGVSGALQWVTSWFNGQIDTETTVVSVGAGPDGNPVVVGFRVGDEQPRPMMLVKYDRTTGSVLWGPIFMTAHQPFEVPVGLAFDQASNILMGWDGAGVLKLSGASGALLWQRHIPLNFNFRVSTDASSAVIALVNGPSGHLEVHKLAGPSGATLWGPITIDAAGFLRGRDLAIDANGDVLVASDGPGITVHKQAGSNGAVLWGPVILPTANVFEEDPKLALDGVDVVVSGSSGSVAIAKLSGASGSVIWGPVETPFLASTSGLVVDAGRIAVAGPQADVPEPAYGVVGYSAATGAPLWSPIDLGPGQGPQIDLDSGGEVIVGATTPGPVDLEITLHEIDLTSGTATWGPVVVGGDGNQQLVGLEARNDTIVLSGPDGLLSRTVGLTEGLGIVDRELPVAYCSSPYDATLQAANGTGAESWSVVSGDLPPGMNLSSSGQLAGTPTQEGMFPVRIAVGAAEKDFLLPVAGALPDLPIFAAALPDCEFQLSVSGSWSDYEWLPGGETTASIDVRPVAPTTYGVLLSDGSGCLRRASVTLPGLALVSSACDAPTLTSIVPDSAPAAGGSFATVLGQQFLPVPQVYIGPGLVPSVFVDDQVMTVVIPSLTPGSLNHLLVRNPDGGSAAILRAFFADFLDVPEGHLFHEFVEALVRAQVTAGCGGGNYCPDDLVLRSQMAVFLLLSKNGPGYTPPPATGTVFNDVGPFDFAADFIEALAAAQITAGCGGGNYCPNDPVTREQMAVFLLKTLEGSTYTPPACVTPTFTDVPCSSPFAKWIEELVDRGITAGCGGGLYCPLQAVSRGQMAVFLTATFGLP